jgi:uncharacterized protein
MDTMTSPNQAPATPPSERTRVRRRAQRGNYDPAVIHAILDEAWLAHLGFVADGQPYVIPTTYVRIGNRVFFHGSTANRTLRAAGGGIPLCFTVSLLDALVFARSHFHHSMNYRSVVVFGTAEPVEEPAQKRAALDALIDRFARGRSLAARPPNEQELKATSVLCLGIAEASAKIRTGPAIDDEADLAEPCWAGVIPLKLVAGVPEPDALLPAGAPPAPELTLAR